MLTSVSRLCRKLTYRRHLRESEAHFGQIRLQAAHPQWQIRLQAAHPQWQIQPPRLRPSLANQPPGTRLLEGQVGRACFQHVGRHACQISSSSTMRDGWRAWPGG